MGCPPISEKKQWRSGCGGGGSGRKVGRNWEEGKEGKLQLGYKNKILKKLF